MGWVPPWSDLPQELLTAIVECLSSNPFDILSFRSVCKSWHSSSHFLSSPTPTLSPPLPLTIPLPLHSLRRCFYHSDPPSSILSITSIYSLHHPSCMPKNRAWLLFLDQSNPGKVCIRQPFSGIPYSMPINFPHSLNLLDLHASKLGCFYNISYLPKQDPKTNKPAVWSGLVTKVVVLFSNGCVFAVVVLSEEGKLGLLRLGLGHDFNNLGVYTQWEIVHDGKGFRFDDVVDYKDRVLGIDRRGRVYEIEIGCASPVIMSSIVPPIAGGGGRRKRLVESLGRLHLVVRCNVRGEADALFKVYELNEGTKRWVEVRSLGEHTFFFGLEFSLSLAAHKLYGLCGKNCILFRERSFLNYSGYDDDRELFSKLESGDPRVGVWRLDDTSHLGLIGAHPGYSNLLWPPPSWIWPKDKSERLQTLISALDDIQSRVPDDGKFNELSQLQQMGALKIMRELLKLVREAFGLLELLNLVKLQNLNQARQALLNQVRQELLNQVGQKDDKTKALEMVAVSLERQSNSVKQHDQVGTSTLGTGESHVSVGSLLKDIIQCNCDLDWFSFETNLNACLFRLEEKTSILEVDLKKLPSADRSSFQEVLYCW